MSIRALPFQSVLGVCVLLRKEFSTSLSRYFSTLAELGIFVARASCPKFRFAPCCCGRHKSIIPEFAVKSIFAIP